jgi:hypothetical protein
VSWLFDLATTNPVAHAAGVLALVCVGGLALGALKFRGVGLGVAGVLLAGIVTGHFGQPIDKRTLDFVRDFGLILFVFMIGLQLGPGFFSTLRHQGVRMNVLAAAGSSPEARPIRLLSRSRSTSPTPTLQPSPTRPYTRSRCSCVCSPRRCSRSRSVDED